MTTFILARAHLTPLFYSLPKRVAQHPRAARDSQQPLRAAHSRTSMLVQSILIIRGHRGDTPMRTPTTSTHDGRGLVYVMQLTRPICLADKLLSNSNTPHNSYSSSNNGSANNNSNNSSSSSSSKCKCSKHRRRTKPRSRRRFSKGTHPSHLNRSSSSSHSSRNSLLHRRTIIVRLSQAVSASPSLHRSSVPRSLLRSSACQTCKAAHIPPSPE